MMDSKVYIQLIFLCVVNVIFTCAGTFLNLLVIVSFWKSSANLRNKLCNFMIMVLSCFDLLVVITNQPILIVDLVLWINEKYDLLLTVRLVEHLVIMFPTFSIMTLLVMSIERYLGAYYPIFHRTSVTKRRLLTFLAILLILPFILIIISFNDMIISYAVFLVVFFLPVFPPIVFINYKLFRISRKVRRNRQQPRTQDNRQHNTTSPIVSSLHVNLLALLRNRCQKIVGCLTFGLAL